MVVRCTLSHLWRWWKRLEVWSGYKNFVICQHTLDPGGSCCALTLLTKSDISLHKNTHLRPPSLFNILMMSSHSIYSQPSPEPRIALPLSPPATALLPSSETLRGELVKYSLLHILRFLPCHLASNQLSDLRDFITPIVPNNLSLQHYMPSGLVLRHFHQVIDELKGLYVPNDTENKLPKPRTGFSVFMSIFSRHM